MDDAPTVADEIRDALRAAAGPLSPREVAKTVPDGTYSYVRKELLRLRDAGEICQPKRGLYALCPPEQGEQREQLDLSPEALRESHARFKDAHGLDGEEPDLEADAEPGLLHLAAVFNEDGEHVGDEYVVHRARRPAYYVVVGKDGRRQYVDAPPVTGG